MYTDGVATRRLAGSSRVDWQSFTLEPKGCDGPVMTGEAADAGDFGPLVDTAAVATDPTALSPVRRAMTTTLESFDRKGWISRFGEALEDTAATARPDWVPFRMYGSIDIDLYRREQHRRYRGMAELARTDPYAAKLFEESHLWLKSLPDGVLDLLLEHPVIEHAWSRGSREAFHFVQVFGGGHADVKFLIANLAKLSVKVGGKRAATMLHRFLVAGEGVRLHAHEIMVLHGLKLDEPVPLGRGAYLASYDDVRKRFGLPEDPEPWLRRSDEGLDLHPGRLARASSRAVLVRQVSWGPAVAPCDCPTNPKSPLKLRYRFPDDHRVGVSCRRLRRTRNPVEAVEHRSAVQAGESHRHQCRAPLDDPARSQPANRVPRGPTGRIRRVARRPSAIHAGPGRDRGGGPRLADLLRGEGRPQHGAGSPAHRRLLRDHRGQVRRGRPADRRQHRVGSHVRSVRQRHHTQDQLARGLATTRVRCRGRHLQGNEILLQGPLQGCPTEPSARTGEHESESSPTLSNRDENSRAVRYSPCSLAVRSTTRANGTRSCRRIRQARATSSFKIAPCSSTYAA